LSPYALSAYPGKPYAEPVLHRKHAKRENSVGRTQRLLTLMDALRRHRRPVTAASLAGELSVSVRTIYRDVQSLVGLGAPIDGEAGLGYLLRGGFFLPPLMFDEDELEALVLGARLVERQGDKILATSARNVLAKIAAAAPKDLRDAMGDTSFWVAPGPQQDSPMLKPLRDAIRKEHKIALVYGDEKGAETNRVIWPIGLAFYQGLQSVAAWCELRSGFRHFRTDRIKTLESTAERYPKRRAVLIKQWRAEMKIPDRE
jgi:predicted DNA-binding transcriptional regulator YafY